MMTGPHARLTAESLAAQLDRAKRSGDGWMACCPAHEDSTPSLKIDDGESGKILLRCHGGCEQRAVLDALADRGIRLNGQAAPPVPTRARTTAEQPPKLAAIMPVPKEAEASFSMPPGAQHRFDYRDLERRLHFIITREDRPKSPAASGGKDHDKRPLPWCYTAQDWRNQAPPRGRIPYGLPDLAQSSNGKRVLVVQGELKRDEFQRWLKSQQLPYAVLTSMGGDSSVLLTDWGALAGRRVAIWPDNDASGRKAALRLAAHLHQLGCGSVRVLEPPAELGPAEDVHDLIKRGQLSTDLLRSMLKAATDWTPPEPEPVSTDATDMPMDSAAPVPTWREAIHQFTNVDDLRREPEPVEWLWHGYLPDRETSLLFGTGKAGKSTLAQELACHVSAGEPFLGAEVRAGRVLYVAGEDSIVRVQNSIRAYVSRALELRWLSTEAEESIVRNLYLLEATGNRFKLLRYLDRAVEAAPEVAGLIEFMRQHPGPWALGIFDTASRLSDGEESNRDFSALVGAVDEFRKAGAASMIVHHSGKGASRAGEVGMDAARGGSSLAFNSRSVLHLIHVPSGSGDKAAALLDKNIATPTSEQVAELDVPGLENGAPRDLVGLVHAACNSGPTLRPRWFVRHGWRGYPILHAFDFSGTVEDARESRRQERDRQKAAESERADIAAGNRVVDSVRRITSGIAGPQTLATLKAIREIGGMNDSTARRGIAWAIGGGRIEMYPAKGGNNRPCDAYRLAGSATSSKEARE